MNRWQAAVAIAKMYFGTAAGKASGAMVFGGIALFQPELLMAGLRLLWAFLAPDRPWPIPEEPEWLTIARLFIGIALVVGGVCLAVFVLTHQPRNDQARARKVIAIRHLSLDPVGVPLTGEMLPPSLAGAEIQEVSIDQTAHHRDGILDAAAALPVQMGLHTRIDAMIQANPGATFAYLGKVHIPLAILAGHALSTGTRFHLFELDRATMARWLPLDETDPGPDLAPRIDRAPPALSATEAVVRISISYPVLPEDLVGAAPHGAQEWHLSIARPKLDPVTTTRQVAEIAGKFREILDEIKALHPGIARVHVFCAAPVSVCFALGQQITSTIHPDVLAYNFSSRTTPRYAWALKINTGGPAEALVHRATPAIA